LEIIMFRRPRTPRNGISHRGNARWAFAICALGLALLAADAAKEGVKTADPDRADAAGVGADAQRAGRLVRVPLPITGMVDENVKQAVRRLIDEFPPDGPRPVLILEFWPQPNTKGEGSEFGRSHSLARFLTSPTVSRVRTIAYVPRSIAGHAVLPAIACEQIIMHPEAEFGNAGVDESSVDATVRRVYTDIANRRRTVPAAVALGLLDKRQQVYVVDGNRYVLGDELEQLKRSGAVAEIETIIPEGEVGNFTGNDMQKKYRFASHLVADRAELAQVLGLPPSAVERDASFGGAWHGVRVNLNGPINERVTSQIQNAITDRMRSGKVNFVLVCIESPGGSPTYSASLGKCLADLPEGEIRTVAYVPEQALSDAALVALGCDHVIMGEGAVLGGAGTQQISKRQIASLRDEVIPQLARQKSRSWSLWAAMIDPDLEVAQYRQEGSGVTGYFSSAELDQQMDPSAWVKVEVATQPGTMLQVTGEQAYEMGLARYVVANLHDLKQIYQLEGDLTTVKPNWALQLIDALAAPELAWMLVFIGGFCLIPELVSPGIGIAGFLACLCFLMFFWSQFLHGTAGWLEILLFVGGVCCILLEILVLPGFGIFGLGGGFMVIASVVLATQTFVLPRNDYQLSQIPQSLFPLAAMLGGVVAALVLMRHILPRTPMVNQVMLPPPEGEQLEEISRREAMVTWDHLVAKHGKTTTPLVPAGKARFGDDLIDVISEGEVIDRGVDIRVVEVHGNRVLVERVEPS
jgi:membrane-bound ClpP family serine protease